MNMIGRVWSIFHFHVYVFSIESIVLLLEACIDVAFFGTFLVTK